MPARNWSIRPLTRPLITFFGAIFVAAGLVLLILPGPGLIFLAAGLAILGVEYPWARWRLRAIRDWLRRRGL